MFKKVTGRAQITATWSELRATTAIAIKGIGAKMAVQGLEDQLLVHATHKVSRLYGFYADQSPADCETSHFDADIEQFRKQLKISP